MKIKITKKEGLWFFSVLLFSTFSFFSFLRYDPRQLSFLVYPPVEVVRNYCGFLGAFFSFSLLFVWGKSFIFLFVALWFSIFLKKIWTYLSSFVLFLFSGFFLWVSLASFFAFFSSSPEKQWEMGGLVGFLCIDLLMSIFSQLGTIFFLIICLFVSSSLFFKINTPLILFKVIQMIFEGVKKLSVGMISVYKRIKGEKKTSSRKRKSRPQVEPSEEPEDIPYDVLEKESEYRGDAIALDNFSQKEPDMHITPYSRKEGGVHFDIQKKDDLLPTLDLLDIADSQSILHDRNKELQEKSKCLAQTLKEFSIKAKVVAVTQGPSVSVFELELEVGTKVNRIVGLSDELSLAMKSQSLRVLGPMPRKNTVGIEIANDVPEMVSLREMLESEEFQKSEHPLTLALGRDIGGKPIISRLDKMPHLLIAGATGAGKSVCMNTIIMSILFKATVDQVQFIMVDPKMVELSFYDNIPHLIAPVVINPEKASEALKWAVKEMERRYKIFSEMGVKNIESYQKKMQFSQNTAEPLPSLPYIVIIVDELADLMMTCAKDVEFSIARLAQLSRAVGIHIILATQRPTVNVITGLIKANLPCRISFRVSSSIDSRTILDTKGAEKLIGRGDMMFIPPGASDTQRIQGAFVSEEETNRVVSFIQQAYQNHNFEKQDIFEEIDSDQSTHDSQGNDNLDPLIQQAKETVLTFKKSSVSFLQRKLGVGYNRACNLMEELETLGVVSAPDGQGRREILMD